MRTTNKAFKEQVRTHIINRLSEDETNVLSEQLENVMDEFRSWYSPYEQKRTPNKHDAFKSFLMGLPSCLSAEFTYYNISESLKEWFTACGEEYKEAPEHKESELYYHLIAREFFALCEKNSVNTTV